jgi:periplasmic divalent cation tolerance protein
MRRQRHLNMTDKRIVLTTVGSDEDARRIARVLVQKQLAACVNIVPQITSVYRWQGKIEESHEWLLIVKTTTDAFPRIREAIGELHPYDLPECICVTVEDGSAAYLEWIAESVATET